MFDEITGQMFWGIASTKSDKIGQLATHYTLQQIIYFKHVIKELIAPESGSTKINGRIQKLQATNLCSLLTEKTFTSSKAEQSLHKFVTDGWLSDSRSYYYLGKRSLLELAAWLREHYGEYIIECFLCSDDVYFVIHSFYPCFISTFRFISSWILSFEMFHKEVMIPLFDLLFRKKKKGNSLSKRQMRKQSP